MYIKEYTKNNNIIIGEHTVPLPDMPPEKEMVNYELKTKDQYYKPLPSYSDFLKRSRAEQSDIVRKLYHVFHNGRWQLINGRPVYVPGVHELQCSYWTTERGYLPNWRWEAAEFFYLLEWVEMDENSLGLLDLKPRRIGDTEKAICWGWWRTIKWRNSKFGMQNKTEDDAYENFERIVNANKSMPPFLRGINKGSDTPKKVLEFKFPSEKFTHKKLSSKKISFGNQEGAKELNSRIDFQATVETGYDSQRLDTIHLDEPGKLTNMDLHQWWAITKKCLMLEGGIKIIGKAVLTSTVEDIQSGKTLEQISKLWHDSDPAIKNKNNRTISGLTRIFRSASILLPDEYGFPKVEEMDAFHDNEIEAMKVVGDLTGITMYKRQFPRSINDALAVPAIDCVLLPALLDDQQDWLLSRGAYNEGAKYSNGKKVENKTVVGDLVWTKGYGSKVKFIENPNGKWQIAQHPSRPNDIDHSRGAWRPKNYKEYSVGLDPTEMRTTEAQIKQVMKDKDTDPGSAALSEAALAVFRPFNPLVDNKDSGIQFNDEGEVLNPDMLETDQFVAIWKHRPQDPFKVAEETLKVCIYYGTKVFAESDKTSTLNTLRQQGYGKFLRFKTKAHVANPTRNRSYTNESGAKATTFIISLYTDALKQWIFRRYRTCHLLPLIKQWRRFKITNRGHLDLAVASGYAIMGAMDGRVKQTDSDKNKEGWKKVTKFIDANT